MLPSSSISQIANIYRPSPAVRSQVNSAATAMISSRPVTPARGYGQLGHVGPAHLCEANFPPSRAHTAQQTRVISLSRGKFLLLCFTWTRLPRGARQGGGSVDRAGTGPELARTGRRAGPRQAPAAGRNGPVRAASAGPAAGP